MLLGIWARSSVIRFVKTLFISCQSFISVPVTKSEKSALKSVRYTYFCPSCTAVGKNKWYHQVFHDGFHLKRWAVPLNLTWVDLVFSCTKSYPGQVKRHSLKFQVEAALKYLVVPLTFAHDCTCIAWHFWRKVSLLQNEKNQIMKSNVWLRLVSYREIRCHYNSSMQIKISSRQARFMPIGLSNGVQMVKIGDVLAGAEN